MKRYDVIVIGSGGGYKLGRPVADLGHKVALIDKGPLGGTCLNRGCIPSKMLIHSADIASTIMEANRFEIDVELPFKVEFQELVKRVNATINEDAESSVPAYEKHPNLDYYRDPAVFIGKKQLKINGELIEGEKIFLAVGARPHIPPIPGLKDVPYMTSKEALRCQKLPKKLIVIGGGYIAAELGYYFGALGSEVHFLVRSKMLSHEDMDIQREFQDAFAQQFPLHLACKVTQVTHNEDTFRVTFDAEEEKQLTIDGDALLIATGVTPWTDILGLEHTDIETDEKGYILVDDHLRTTEKNVWALGDCIGRHLYRHTVNYEGEYLFRTLFQDPSDQPIHYGYVPHAVFSRPQIGSVGLREQDLVDKGVDYVVGYCPYSSSAMGMALQSERGFVKLLFNSQSRELIGAHCIGDEASNMVHMAIAYMKMHATVDDITDTIFIHPALPEIVRNAARDAATKLPHCRVAQCEQWE